MVSGVAAYNEYDVDDLSYEVFNKICMTTEDLVVARQRLVEFTSRLHIMLTDELLGVV